MTQNGFTFLSGFLAQVFRLFTSWYIPGTNVTPAGLMFFLLCIPFAFKFIRRLFIGFSDGASSRGE